MDALTLRPRVALRCPTEWPQPAYLSVMSADARCAGLVRAAGATTSRTSPTATLAVSVVEALNAASETPTAARLRHALQHALQVLRGAVHEDSGPAADGPAPGEASVALVAADSDGLHWLVLGKFTVHAREGGRWSRLAHSPPTAATGLATGVELCLASGDFDRDAFRTQLAQGLQLGAYTGTREKAGACMHIVDTARPVS